MNLVPVVISWALLGIAMLALALYRKSVMLHQQDELVHLSAGEEKMIRRQVELSHKIDLIDNWGETLTVLTMTYGLWIAVSYVSGRFR